ncbi:hypothetical protein DKH14_09830 [Salmonella enterica]|nr:hypothetical protein [Salmonella enterica]
MDVKLIDISVQELPARGGWPEFALALTQDGDGSICLWEDVDVYQQGGAWAHPSGTGLLEYWCNNQAMKPAEDRSKAIITREQYEAALAASKTEWDGEGLPPVGCECEYETNGYGIKKVRVECITMDGIAFTWLGEDPRFRGLDCINTSQAHRFRPIRSEADKKKEAVEKAIADALLKDGDFDHE